MKTIQKILLLIMVTLSLNSFSQSLGDYYDVVYLKNGSIIKGIMIEQIPGKSIKILTNDGSEYVYLTSEIEKFTRETTESNYESIKFIEKLEKLDFDSSRIKWRNDFKRKNNGYYIEFDLMSFSNGSARRMTNGFKFNNSKYVGVAIGVETHNNFYFGDEFSESRYTNSGKFGSINLVFASDLKDKRITPFYQAELGLGFALDGRKKVYDGYSKLRHENFGGPMAGFSYGYKFRTKKKITYKLSLDLRLSSNYSENEYHYKDSNTGALKIGTDEEFGTNSALGLRFGIGF